MSTERTPIIVSLERHPDEVAKLMRSPNTTLVILVIDSSGSMSGLREITQECFNRCLTQFKNTKDGRHYFIGVVIFADEPKVLVQFSHVSDIGEITNYCPSGGTLLYATVDQVLEFLEAKAQETSVPIEPDLRVVIAIFSDGHDNKSDTSIYPKKLQATAKRAIDRGWELLTYGIGVDADQIATKMGLTVGNGRSMSVERSAEGLDHTTSHLHNTATTGRPPRPMASGTPESKPDDSAGPIAPPTIPPTRRS